MLGAEGPTLAADARAPGSPPRARRPLLPVAGAAAARDREALLRSMHHPAIYVMNAAHLSRSALGALARLGRVTEIPESEGAEAKSPRRRPSIAAARFTDGSFGWGVKEPGHGLVFANSSRPLDAPAAALLSATGDYGPLLLLEAPQHDPPAAGRLPRRHPARLHLRARIPRPCAASTITAG